MDMSDGKDTQTVEGTAVDEVFQQSLSKVTVLLFSGLLLWEFGFVDTTVALTLLLASLAYPAYRVYKHTSFAEIGVKVHGLRTAIIQNWRPMAIYMVAMGLLVRVVEWLYPPFYQYGIETSPVDAIVAPLVSFIQVVALGPPSEEILFRGILQRYTAFFAPSKAAIVYSSVVFALTHFAAGDPLSVALDLTFHFLHGCFYGLIFSRSQNALISFIPHSLWNLSAFIIP